MKISKVTKKDFSDWLKMGWLFYSKHPKEKIKKEFEKILRSNKEAALICKDTNENPVGFINISIRSDYVEGSKTNPVGYIEAIYVKKEYRKKGVARMLIKEAQKWFADRGLSEIGSDAEIHNKISQKLHRRTGFKRGETIVHYIKKIQ